MSNSSHRVCELASAVPYLLARGVQPGKVLKAVGVPTHVLLDPDAWISRDLFLALINALAAATGDPHCGIHIAEMDSILKLGAMGEAILDAPTLRAALEVVSRRATLVQTGTVIQLRENRHTARLSYSMVGRTGENPAQYLEGVLMFFQKLLALTGQAVAVEVSFDHMPSRRSQELERVFGTGLSFHTAENALVFDREVLDLPLQSSPTTARQVLPERPSEEEVIRAVLNIVSGQLAYAPPTLESTAATLGFHARTLERRLSRWGTPFESLLDEFRRSRSLQLIQQGAHTMTDIAFLVGYADSAHFTRAFRRWTGMPPREYGRRLRDQIRLEAESGTVKEVEPLSPLLVAH